MGHKSSLAFSASHYPDNNQTCPFTSQVVYSSKCLKEANAAAPIHPILSAIQRQILVEEFPDIDCRLDFIQNPTPLVTE
ncbi:unnamed protein product [Musa acuminata subsp. burmannicoides]